MSDTDTKTIPAALEALLRPRRMKRIHGTVARTRADGAWFDAMLWSAFAFLAVGVLLVVLSVVDSARLGVNETWLVAGSVLLAIFVAAALWWRWFKWHVHATVLAERDAGSSGLDTRSRG